MFWTKDTIRPPGHKAALLQAVQHPAHRSGVNLKVVRQFPLTAGPPVHQVVQQLGLPRPQPQLAQAGPQEVALGVKRPVQQHMEGSLHVPPPPFLIYQ